MFRIQLQVSAQCSAMPPAQDCPAVYDPEVDSIVGLLHDLCEALDAAQRVMFWVEGFGQKPWPVDVPTDLSVCLSELPKVTQWLEQGCPGQCEWRFYEQGLDRKLVLEGQGELICVRCVACGAWKPDPEVEVVPRADLRAMLRETVRVFHEQAEAVCPQTTAHRWFQHWRSSVELK